MINRLFALTVMLLVFASSAQAGAGSLNVSVSPVPPNLSAGIKFSEPSGNSILDAGETGKIILTVMNSGKGDAFDVVAHIEESRKIPGLSFSRTAVIGTVAAGSQKTIDIPVIATQDVPGTDVSLTIKLEEANGFEPQPMRIAFRTKEFVPPKLIIADMGISDSSANSRIEPMEIVEVTARIQNVGHGAAKNVQVDVETGPNVFLAGDIISHFELGILNPGQYQDVKFMFYTNNRIANAQKIPISLKISEANPKYSINEPLNLAMNAPQKGIQDFVIAGVDTPSPGMIAPATGLSVDVDINIPSGYAASEHDVAVIICNRRYTAKGVPDVAYADRDGKIMREYLISAFGYKPENIIFEEDATLSKFNEVFGTEGNARGRLSRYVKPDSNVFVYYVGHGAPDIETQEAYFVPVDANPQYIATNGYKLQTFYSNLSKVNARKITVVIDACFSGNSDKGFLFTHISPAAVKVKKDYKGPANATVMTSAAMDQVSSWYKDKRHSLFTYYFLKGIQGDADKKGDGVITVGDMKEYLAGKVPYMAGRLNNVEQTPVVAGNDSDVIVRLRK